MLSYKHNSYTLLVTKPWAVSFQGLVVSRSYNATVWFFQCRVGFITPAQKLD